MYIIMNRQYTVTQRYIQLFFFLFWWVQLYCMVLMAMMVRFVVYDVLHIMNHLGEMVRFHEKMSLCTIVKPPLIRDKNFSSELVHDRPLG